MRASDARRGGRRDRGRASLALVGVPVTVLLALSAFGENARGKTRGRRAARRFGGDERAASAAALARAGDEALGRVRATALDYEKVVRDAGGGGIGGDGGGGRGGEDAAVRGGARRGEHGESRARVRVRARRGEG